MFKARGKDPMLKLKERSAAGTFAATSVAMSSRTR